MKRSKLSEEQIVYAIRQAEAGTPPVDDLCRQLGVSDATFYAWKQTYAHLGVSELQGHFSSSAMGPGHSMIISASTYGRQRPSETDIL